jgi:outer membrane protein OmpA-like peptidoglycan-associated protein
MAQLKRKVQLKRKSEIDIPVAGPPKRKNKILLPLLIIGLLVIIVSGYFLLNSGGSEEQQITQNDKTQNQDNDEVASVPSNSLQVQNELTGKSDPTIPYKQGEVYKVYQFPFGASDYSQPNPELDKLVEVMKQNPTIKISVLAYTDNVGDPDYNQILSVKRAKAINDYLVRKGIEASRLSFQGKGISTKYQSNSENRRAEFVLSD